MSEAEPDLEAGVAVAATSSKAPAKLDLHFITAPPPRPIRHPPPPSWPPMKVDGGTPRQQWDFVRKVYATVLLQYCLAGGVVAVTCFVPAVPRFFTSGPHVAASYFALVVIVVAPFVALWPMIKYREKHPVNLLLLGLVTLCFSLSIGVLTNAFTTIGRGVLQFTVLIGAAMTNLIIYTLWAAMRQYQVTTYCPFLINHVLMFLFYLLTQAYCPLGSFNVTFFGCFFAMMFAVFVVYDIPLLIERHSSNEHIFAAILLYPDIINISVSYCLAPCKRHC